MLVKLAVKKRSINNGKALRHAVPMHAGNSETGCLPRLLLEYRQFTQEPIAVVATVTVSACVCVSDPDPLPNVRWTPLV